MTYKEYTEMRQKGWNELPIRYAFGYEQFYKFLDEEGWNEDDVVSLGYGGFTHRDNLPEIKAFIEADDLAERMKDTDFAYEAFMYEMANHEYHINLEGDYDVCSCFGHIDWAEDDIESYFIQLGWEPQTVKAYESARRDFLLTAHY